MRRMLSLVLTLSLLVGCGAQGTTVPSTAESAQTVQTAPAPTAAVQSLTVSGRADTAAWAALQNYAEHNGVSASIQTEGTAELVVLSAPPAADSGYLNLAEDSLLAAAAKRAGLTGDTITALPLGKSLYAYWADRTALETLLGEGCVPDLQKATWQEWSNFVTAAGQWVLRPHAVSVTLNGNVYTLPDTVPETMHLSGVFALPFSDLERQFCGPMYTTALLAAGASPTVETLAGPVNGLFSALALELVYPTDSTEGLLDHAACAKQLLSHEALFYRTSLADLCAAAPECDTLVAIPIKCELVKEDLANTEYDLNGLNNAAIFAGNAWLAIPDDTNEAEKQAARAALLWLYTSAEAETYLTETLNLATPWNTASNQTTLGAMQVDMVSTGILPGVERSNAALREAGANLLWDSNGVRVQWTMQDRTAWRDAVSAALAQP